MRAGAGLLSAAGAVVSACGLALYAHVAWPWLLLGWGCLVPWLAALDRATTLAAAAAAGVLMSVGFAAAVFPWFPDAVVSYTGAPWPLGLLILIVVAPLIEPQFVGLAVGRHLARRVSGTGWWTTAFIGAGTYVGTEWAFPKLFGDTLGHGLYAAPSLIQAADLAGAHGLTFLMIFANQCGLELIRRLWERAETPRLTKRLATPVTGLVLPIVGLAAYGSARLSQVDRLPIGGEINVALIQANVGHYDRLKADLGTYEAVRRILEIHFELSGEALREGNVDLLVWPETVYPTTFGSPKSADGAGFDRAIAAFVTDVRVPLVFGAYDLEDGNEFNAAILLEPDAAGPAAFDTYRKTRLFPFTEYLPGPLESERMRRWLPWAGTWRPGNGPKVLSLSLQGDRKLRVAPLICYDALDSGFALTAVDQGAELLLTLSNDSWFAFPGVQRLILIISAFRSIETRRPQLRVTPTGISALIDEAGTLRAVIAEDSRSTLVGSLTPRASGWTLMLAWGDWFAPAALAAALVLLTGSRATRAARPS